MVPIMDAFQNRFFCRLIRPTYPTDKSAQINWILDFQFQFPSWFFLRSIRFSPFFRWENDEQHESVDRLRWMSIPCPLLYTSPSNMNCTSCGNYTKEVVQLSCECLQTICRICAIKFLISNTKVKFIHPLYSFSFLLTNHRDLMLPSSFHSLVSFFVDFFRRCALSNLSEGIQKPQECAKGIWTRRKSDQSCIRTIPSPWFVWKTLILCCPRGWYHQNFRSNTQEFEFIWRRTYSIAIKVGR